MIAAGNAALGLWLRSGAYAAQHLTDGIVPGVIAKMYGSKPQIAKLTAAGLWHTSGHTCRHPKCLQPAAGDFMIHDYLEYNPSRRQVLDRKSKAAEKKRRQRAGTGPEGNHGGFGEGSRPDREGFDDESSAERAPEGGDCAGHGRPSPGDNGGTRAHASPSPPIPSPSGGAGREPSAGSSARGRGALSSIPADWQPTDDDVRAAQLARADSGRSRLTAQQLTAVTRKFVRRMADDGVQAAGFGGRWQQWAENERTEPAAPGGVVVPFAQQPTSKAQQQVASLGRLRDRLNGGTAS
ncbi:hypothetical protein STRAU_6097 [Streptomyces aurantiacus JA 4570]|uniref:Uncharacterized protein n=2 Tax=Streptomyces aurantiacus TaxID=47760 RepID=S4AHC7_9ACTN|nr:hypothetical protein STRAU_6097 [Streptomyces aurantiacus JA 4570]